MRRQDRKVTDPAIIRDILESAQVFHLAITDPASPAPYVIPLNFGYKLEGDRLRLFFHGALAGRKYDLLKDGPHPAGFALDCGHELVLGEETQHTTYAYRSLIGEGTVRQLTEPEEMRRALEVLMACLTKKPTPVSDDALHVTAVYELAVEHFEAKQNQPK
jgi:nitroimidazol reductase NimA-like FMN-containing flavoprotein (pyridoxamine 5'-phosphate oxidase superfamily)